MRQQGRVVEWHDARGYGFVVTHATEQRLFLHIKQFTRGALRRPKAGDILTYEVVPGTRGKLAAVSVSFAGTRKDTSAKRRAPSFAATAGWGAAEVAALLLGCVLVWLVRSCRLPWQVAASYPLLSMITYAAYAHDKQAAISGRWRTPESTLQGLALIGGWPGAWLAQKWLRHKSRKFSFQFTFWVVVVLNLAGLVWLSRWLAVG